MQEASVASPGDKISCHDVTFFRKIFLDAQDQGSWPSLSSKLEAELLSKHRDEISKAGFLNPGNLDILGQITFYCGGCSVHCKRFSSIPGFYLLEASSTLLLCPVTSLPYCNLKCFQTFLIAQITTGGKTGHHPSIEHHCSRDIQKIIRKTSAPNLRCSLLKMY